MTAVQRSAIVRATLLALLVAAVAAIPSFAAAPATTASATTVEHAQVAATGTYIVVMTVPAIAAAVTADVSAGSQVQRAVAIPAGQAIAFTFTLHLTHRSVTARIASSGDAVPFTVTATRLTAHTLKGPASTGSTGSAGSTGSTTPVSHTFYGPSRGPYRKLVWADTFDGRAGSAPNAANWSRQLGGGCGPGSVSTATADPANAHLDGRGNLEISALSSGPSQYTAAQLNSNHRFSFRYGEIEARIQLPVGSGLCSAFWMVGDASTDLCFPQLCGEMDVLESISPYPEWAFQALHGPVSGSPNYQQWLHIAESATSLAGTYHTYGMIWQPNRIRWTLDGATVAAATPKDLPASARWMFSGHSFHLLLSLSVGGWPGPPDAGAKFPATMRVAWVRVFT